MLRRISSLAMALLSCMSSVSGQSILCQIFGLSQLQCAMCGYTPSAPIYCVAYNATFDDLTANQPIPIYKNTAWPGFMPLAQQSSIISRRSRIQRTGNKVPKEPRRQPLSLDTSLTLKPYSAPNYAYLPPNTTGSMVFGYEGGVDPMQTNGQLPLGTLHNFHYACAVPNTNPPIATPCKITISAVCLAQNESDWIHGSKIPVNSTINYDPGLPTVGGSGGKDMAFQAIDFSYEGYDQGIASPQKCTNYSFSAQGGVAGVNVLPVTLLLDDILFNTYAKGYSG